MLRSLKVTDGWLKRVKQALSRYDFSSQKALAEELEISSRKASDFFNGKSVDYEIFVAICARLGLDWQKVAKVSPEMIKSVTSSKPETVAPISPPQILKEIEHPIEGSKPPEGIPKLASSLFKSFDSQDRIAQKKFINTPVSADLDKNLTESIGDVPDNLSNSLVESLSDSLLDDLSQGDLLQVHTNVLPDSTELADIPIDNQHDELSNKTEAALPIQKSIPQTTKDRPIELKSEPKTSEIKLPQNKPAEGVIQELLGISNPVQTPPLNPKSIAQIQELLGMAAIKPDKASIQQAEPVRDLELLSLNVNSPLEAINEISTLEDSLEDASKKSEDVVEKISEVASEEIEKEISEEVNIGNVESIPSFEFSQPDNLEPIIAAYYDFCKVQDWDMAATVVNSVNLAHVKTSNLALILDLYHQLLPPKWQDGEQKISDRLIHIQVICNAGMAAFYLDKFTDAVSYYESVLAIVSALDSSELKLKIKALNGLGTIYQALAQYQSAIKYFQQAQVLATELNDGQLKLQALGNLGNIYYALGQYRTAITYYQEFIGRSNGKDLVELEFSVIGNLGNAFYNLKEYQIGIGYQQKYLEVARMIGNAEKEAGCLVSLGFAYYALGLYQTAIEHYNQAKAIADRFNYKRMQISIFSGLGLSYQALKNYSTAVVCFHKCLEVTRQVGDRSSEVRALYNLRKANSYQLI